VPYAAVGILSHGAYLPRMRLARAAIAQATGWLSQAAAKRTLGERTICNWDEDSVTMAVEAGRDCLRDHPRANVAAVTLASTTAPFDDRSNAVLAAGALGLGASTRTLDAGGSQRAATSSLLAMLQRRQSTAVAGEELLLAAERRLARPGSEQEAAYGHGAAALLLGSGDSVIAEYLGGASVQADLVDHFRGRGADFDYSYEERWIRDEGWLKLVPAAISVALADAQVDPAAVRHLVLPCPARLAQQIAAAAGLGKATVGDDLREGCGDLGVPQSLLLLSERLPALAAGEVLVLCGFGQGCDALVLRATGAGAALSPRGARPALARGKTDHEYLRFLAHSGLVEVEQGMRAERDSRTAQSVYYRHRDELAALVGGRCARCGTVQFPLTRGCVNPDCRACDSQTEFPLAERRARVKSFTEDWLAFTPNPPLIYGNVEFDVGGNLFAEFADVAPGELAVGSEVGFAFRIKDYDRLRRHHRYFWKAVPVRH
jgi:3-hydroxy-3-methylglutaryl CoA synthase